MAVKLRAPAALRAVHVNSPSWRYATASMLRKLAVPPSWAVDRAGSALTSRPAADHVIVIGGSPRTTEQMICARSPSLRTGLPKLKGTISGGSRQARAG